MQEPFKYFSVKILDYYNITVHSLVCNKKKDFLESLFTVLAGRTKALRVCDFDIAGHLKESFSNADFYS